MTTTYQKCPCCDGYGTRPSRKTEGKFVKCRGCKGAGLLWQFDLTSGAAPEYPDWMKQLWQWGTPEYPDWMKQLWQWGTPTARPDLPSDYTIRLFGRETPLK